MYKLLVLNGPNLNLLGKREPHIYGHKTLNDVNSEITQYAQKRDVAVDFFQSNHEGELIDRIHSSESYDGIVFNPGAYTHTSFALYDAMKGVTTPVVEVHISNIFSRDEFRKNSVTASAAIGSISGFGFTSYLLGVDALLFHLDKKNANR